MKLRCFGILVAALVVLATLFFALVLAFFATRTGPPPEEVMETKTEQTQQIQTLGWPDGQAEVQTFEVPGPAFVDGRDPAADPPLTIMWINVWTSPARTRTTCRLPHGEPVQLLDVRLQEDESRYYFRVKGRNCSGWLPENFLHTESAAPVGDRL